jgi:hypothetical protein
MRVPVLAAVLLPARGLVKPEPNEPARERDLRLV